MHFVLHIYNIIDKNTSYNKSNNCLLTSIKPYFELLLCQNIKRSQNRKFSRHFHISRVFKSIYYRLLWVVFCWADFVKRKNAILCRFRLHKQGIPWPTAEARKGDFFSCVSALLLLFKANLLHSLLYKQNCN